MGIYFPISVVHIQGRKSEGNGWGQAEEPHEGLRHVFGALSWDRADGGGNKGCLAHQ